MKKNVLLIVLLPALAACSTELDDSGTFYVPVEVETRGADAAPVETQVLAFTGSGRLAAYSKGAPAGLRLRRSVTYDILALSGCPDVNLEGLSSRSAVEAVNMGLGEYDDPGTGFAASASSRVTLTGTATRSISLAADRYVCRIRLVSVKNGLPPSMGSVVLKNAFLSNVVASQTIGAAGSGWLNPMGRAGETPPAEGHVIDGVTYKVWNEAAVRNDAGHRLGLLLLSESHRHGCHGFLCRDGAALHQAGAERGDRRDPALLSREHSPAGAELFL